MEQKTILFDLDGTLTDSGEGIIHCAQLALEGLGLPVPCRQELRFLVGPPLADSFARLGVPPQEIDRAIEIYRINYQDFGKYENFPYPGIEGLLKKLKADGHPLYVATSKPEALSVDILEHFGLAAYFERICGASMDRSRSTKAQVIGYLLEHAPVKGRLLMVGDTVYDVQGAGKLGIPTVGVAWGYGVIDEMTAAGAIGIAENMEQLYDILCNF